MNLIAVAKIIRLRRASLQCVNWRIELVKIEWK